MMLQAGGGGLANSCRAGEGTENQMEWIEMPTIYKAKVIRDQTMSNPTTNL